MNSGVFLGLVEVSDTFYFFCSGKGKGESEAPGGGRSVFFIQKCQEGGGVSEEGRGVEGPGGCLRGIGRGGC